MQLKVKKTVDLAKLIEILEERLQRYDDDYEKLLKKYDKDPENVAYELGKAYQAYETTRLLVKELKELL